MSADEPSPDSRRQYYSLTDAGHRVLAEEARRLARLVHLPEVSALVTPG